MPLQQNDDGSLVLAAQKGELHAFEQLVERYQRQATAISYRLLNNRDDAMEVTQDAFLKAYEKLGTLSQPERFGPWLLRIVSNLSLNRRRSRALRRTTSLDATPQNDDGRNEYDRPDTKVATPEDIATARDMKEQIEAAIEKLPEKQRMALVLFSIAKMPQNEVAEVLGCSVEAVKWHVFMARKKLKEDLEDYL